MGIRFVEVNAVGPSATDAERSGMQAPTLQEAAFAIEAYADGWMSLCMYLPIPIGRHIIDVFEAATSPADDAARH